MNVPLVEFDRKRAHIYRPDDAFIKTAVLVQPADESADLTIMTAFGNQTVRGAFYAVAERDGSYAVERDRFERTHRRVAPHRWVKEVEVLAYQVDRPCRVITEIDGRTESDVIAQPGDWVVQQQPGETFVVSSSEFEVRYRPIDGQDDRGAEARER